MGFTHKHCKIGDGGFHVHNTNRLGSWVAATSKPYTLYMNPQENIRWNGIDTTWNRTRHILKTLHHRDTSELWRLPMLADQPNHWVGSTPVKCGPRDAGYRCQQISMQDGCHIGLSGGSCWTSWIWLGWADLLCSQYPIPSTGWTSILPEHWPSTPETQGNYTFLQSNLAGKSPN